MAKADYRKSMDLAREIFEEIEKYSMFLEDITHSVWLSIGASIFAELKKKYQEGEG